MTIMDDAEILRRREKARRSTIFKDGKVINVDHIDWQKTRICGVHLKLANKLDTILEDGTDKEEVLAMVDKAYNQAKRMATKLDECRFGVEYNYKLKEVKENKVNTTIDIAMTASIRPDIIERTLNSIGKNIEYRPLRLIVDIAPVGEVDKYNQEYVLEVIESTLSKYDIGLLYRKLSVSLQAEALRWTWENSSSDYVLQWEDDWVLHEKLDLGMLIDLMRKYFNIGMLYFDRKNKSVLDYKGYKGVFVKSQKKYNSNIYVRVKGKSLGGPPALLRQEYIRQVLPLIKDNVCLDTMSHDPEVMELLSNWMVCVYVGKDGKGNIVEDIGKEWKKKNNIVMRKNTSKGVQWIRN